MDMKNIVGIVVLIALVAGFAWLADRAPSRSGNDNVSNDNGSSVIEQNEQGAFVVRYTENGFVPSVIAVERGSQISFRNETNQVLEVSTEEVPTALNQPYAGFEQSDTLANGEAWSFTFVIEGEFKIKNTFNDAHLGTIQVTREQ